MTCSVRNRERLSRGHGIDGMDREKTPTTPARMWTLLPRGAHVALFYADEEERRSAVREFIETGLAAGECVGYVGDKDTPEEILHMLESMGVKRPNDPRALCVAPAGTTYCPGGVFVPADVVQHWHGVAERLQAEGFRVIRATGEMSWALRGMPGAERLLEYEQLVDVFLKEQGITALCQYDVTRFSGTTLGDATIFSLMKAHPWVIIGNRLFENPFHTRECAGNG